jgi:Flp pilus assembly protein TadB
MVSRRAVAAAIAAGLAVLAWPAPAMADEELAVTVGPVTSDRVELVVAVPGGGSPTITVSRNGRPLPVSAPGPTRSIPKAVLREVIVVLAAGADMQGTRMQAARAGLTAFADAAPADVAIGLMLALDEPREALAPTRDHTRFKAALAAVTADGVTGVYGGVLRATRLDRSATNRRLVVVAGGPSPDPNADAVVTEVRADGHRVDMVSVGAGADGLAALRALALESDGTVNTAATVDDLTSQIGKATSGFGPLMSVTVTVPTQWSGTGNLLVAASAGAQRFTTEVPVRFAPPATTSGVDQTEVSLWTRIGPQWFAGIVFGVVLLAFLLAAFGLGIGSNRRRRLKQVEQFRIAAGTRVTGQSAAQRLESGVRAVPDRVIRAGGGEQRMAERLDNAGIAMQPKQWTTIRLVALVIGAILVGILLGLIGVLIGALVAWLVTGAYPRWRERRRQAAFADQLPEALQMIVGSLRSGFSLAQALDGVVRDSPPGPLTVELGRALSEVRLGADLADALERTATRVNSDDLAWAVIAIRIQRDTGGNLAEILETTVETIRERGRLARHVRALSAEGRLSAYVLIALPFVLAGWMWLIRRDYLSALWTTPLGLGMLTAAGVLMAIGIFWMSRWIRVEV